MPTFFYFRFPHDPNIKEKWIRIIQDDRREWDWLPSHSSVVCSDHFSESDRYKTGKGRYFLKRDVIPIIKDQDVQYGRSVSPISASVSDTNSIFDTSHMIYLKKKIRKMELAKEKHMRTIKNLRKLNSRITKKAATLAENMRKLNNKNGTDRDTTDLELSGYAVYKRVILKKKKDYKNTASKYSTRLHKSAFNLNCNLTVPCKHFGKFSSTKSLNSNTLCRWYNDSDGNPGFTQEAFAALHDKHHSVNGERLTCGLIVSNMPLCQQKIWNGKKYIGCVDMGNVAGQTDEIATQAHVLLIASLVEYWKIPVGYFLVNGLSGEEKAHLIDICLRKCHDEGVDIVSVTFDGCSSNIEAANILGCQLSDATQLKTYFLHPCTSLKVVVWLDPRHLIKLVRNAFESKRIIYAGDGEKILWKYIERLQELHKKENVANKLSSENIYFHNQIIKVTLATQLFSTSVVNALKFCDGILKSPSFKGSAATVDFIVILNNLFDVLTSRKLNFLLDFKRPIDQNTKYEMFTFLDHAKIYISSLYICNRNRRRIIRTNGTIRTVIHNTKSKVIDSEFKTGFLGLIVCIDNLKLLFDDLVEDKSVMNFISTYRLSEDHIEMLFANYRRNEGNNNDPTAKQFIEVYKKTLTYMNFKSPYKQNCIPFENFSVLCSSSVEIINNSTNISGHEELTSESASHISDAVYTNCNILTKLLDQSEYVCSCREQIIGYISGWVARSLIRKMKCETCVDELMSREKRDFHKLIDIKYAEGSCFASVDVFIVCLNTEKIVCRYKKENTGQYLPSKYTLQFITVRALKQFLGLNIFSDLADHSYESPATYNHRLHLIRAIIQEYSKVRLHSAAKSDYFRRFGTNRQKFKRLVLFEAQ